MHRKQTIFASSDGTAWHQLHSEREEICEAILRNIWQSEKTSRAKNIRSEQKELTIDRQLEARLRLIDDALDRLTNVTPRTFN